MITWEHKKEIAYSYIEVLVYIASLARLERPYKKSVCLVSYTDQKAVVLSKNEGDYLYQFCGRPFDKEEEEEEKEEKEEEEEEELVLYSGVFCQVYNHLWR